MGKDFKKWYLQLPCLTLCTRGIMWRTSRQACFLCPWARHLTVCLHLYEADSWPVYPSWWPSLTEYRQKGLTRSLNSRSFFKKKDLAQMKKFKVRRNYLQLCCNQMVATIRKRNNVHVYLLGENICGITKRHLQC